MEPDRFGIVGGLAADRPLLTSLVFAVGAAALVVVGLLEGDDGFRASSLAFLGAFLVIVAAPVFFTSVGPSRFAQQLVYLSCIAALLVLIAITARRVSFVAAMAPPQLTAVLLSCFFVSAFLVLMAPAFSGTVRQFGVSVLAAGLGAVAALGAALWFLAAIAPTQTMAAPGDNAAVLAAMSTLGAALSVMLAVLLSGEIAEVFSHGGDNRSAAGVAARIAGAPAFFGVVIAAVLFAIYLLTGSADGLPAHVGLVLAFLCALLPSYAVLLLGAGAFALRTTTEAVAVAENHRRLEMRRAWRPFRSVLPASSSMAIMAIAGVLSVVAAFELTAPLHVAEFGFIGFSALCAMLIFVSVRSALLVIFLQIVGLLLLSWATQSAGFLIPPLLERLIAIAMATTLFAQFALSWRDARSPRRKPHEATEAAVVDGAFRYGIGVVAASAVLLAAYISGFWPGAAQTASYFVGLSVIGLFLAPAVMTALGALLGRD